MAKILIVEDEPTIALGLKNDLKLEGHAVEVAADGETAARRAGEGAFDLILFDLMLPRKDGLTIGRELRHAGVRTPIIMNRVLCFIKLAQPVSDLVLQVMQANYRIICLAELVADLQRQLELFLPDNCRLDAKILVDQNISQTCDAIPIHQSSIVEPSFLCTVPVNVGKYIDHPHPGQKCGSVLHIGGYVVRVAGQISPCHPSNGQLHLPFHDNAPLLAVAVRSHLANGFDVHEYDLMVRGLRNPASDAWKRNVRLGKVGDKLRECGCVHWLISSQFDAQDFRPGSAVRAGPNLHFAPHERGYQWLGREAR
jgi:hypothetical protein